MFSILISHFLLDLRGAFKTDLNQRAGLASDTVHVSSIRFTTVIDDMSVMLDTPWGSDETDGTDDTDRDDQSDELSFALPKSPDSTESPASELAVCIETSMLVD